MSRSAEPSRLGWGSRLKAIVRAAAPIAIPVVSGVPSRRLKSCGSSSGSPVSLKRNAPAMKHAFQPKWIAQAQPM